MRHRIVFRNMAAAFTYDDRQLTFVIELFRNLRFQHGRAVTDQCIRIALEDYRILADGAACFGSVFHVVDADAQDLGRVGDGRQKRAIRKLESRRAGSEFLARRAKAVRFQERAKRRRALEASEVNDMLARKGAEAFIAILRKRDEFHVCS